MGHLSRQGGFPLKSSFLVKSKPNSKTDIVDLLRQPDELSQPGSRTAHLLHQTAFDWKGLGPCLRPRHFIKRQPLQTRLKARRSVKREFD